MISFNFLDKDSFEDFGIKIKKRPNIPMAERRVNYIPIQGRSGLLTMDDGTYDNITIPVECFLVDKYDLVNNLYLIKAWLSNGIGDLIFSWDKDRKYIGQVVKGIDIVQSYKVLGAFTITFNCQPFSYAVASCFINVTEQKTGVYNAFTYFSLPKITIFGNGDITLYITDYFENEQKVILTNVVDEITIDSTLEECYKQPENAILVRCNDKMDGEFPILKVAENYISWDGNVSSIDILLNDRFL